MTTAKTTSPPVVEPAMAITVGGASDDAAAASAIGAVEADRVSELADASVV